MGRSHNDPTTFPRLADPLATVRVDVLRGVLEAVVGVHRDHGDRVDRDHARLKYLVAAWGIDGFRDEVARRVGRVLDRPEPVDFAASDDHLGWHPQGDGRWSLGVKVDNGRIVDTPAVHLRSGLREAVARTGAGVALTAREDELLTDVAECDRAVVDALLRAHDVVDLAAWSPVRRHSFSCPALPTCGLALTESERVFPEVLGAVEQVLSEVGLAGLDLHVRMTGCPNGCARPYTAEIGLVGRGKRSYDILLGGDAVGTHLNEVFAENVPREHLAAVVRPVLERYRDDRDADEAFGPFCRRIGVAELRRRSGTERWVRARGRSAAADPGGAPGGGED
jgi:sulfite reductase (ferredoxin)